MKQVPPRTDTLAMNPLGASFPNQLLFRGVQFPLPSAEADTSDSIPLNGTVNFVRRPGILPKQVPFSPGSHLNATIARIVMPAPSAQDEYSVTMAQTQRNLGRLGIDPDYVSQVRWDDEVV